MVSVEAWVEALVERVVAQVGLEVAVFVLAQEKETCPLLELEQVAQAQVVVPQAV